MGIMHYSVVSRLGRREWSRTPGTSLLRRGVPVLAGIVLCASGIAGCAEDPPEPSTINDTQTTSQEPSPTPTPTSTLSAEEQEAVEAATAAYHLWYDVVGRLSKAPQDYTGSEIRAELYKVGGDPQARETMDILRSSQELGRVQKGDRKVEGITAEGVILDVGEGQYPEVLLRVCVDTSGIDLVDYETGKSLLPADRQTKWVTHIKLWQYESAWHVVEDETRSKEEKC